MATVRRQPVLTLRATETGAQWWRLEPPPEPQQPGTAKQPEPLPVQLALGHPSA